jgi:hypothetical protein
VKKLTRSKIISRLDTEFSRYIRTRKSVSGYATCYTCGKKDHWKNLQAGHFQSRKHYSTRWDEINVQVQCAGCNIFKSGEQFMFSKQLDIEYGVGVADELYHKAHTIQKFSTKELLDMLEHYKSLNKASGLL